MRKEGIVYGGSVCLAAVLREGFEESMGHLMPLELAHRC